MKKPSQPREQIDPDRLIEATEAVMKAVDEVFQATGKRVHPPSLMGTMLQPKVLCDFTLFEVEEATAFLARMGFIQTTAA